MDISLREGQLVEYEVDRLPDGRLASQGGATSALGGYARSSDLRGASVQAPRRYPCDEVDRRRASKLSLLAFRDTLQRRFPFVGGVDQVGNGDSNGHEELPQTCLLLTRQIGGCK